MDLISLGASMLKACYGANTKTKLAFNKKKSCPMQTKAFSKRCTWKMDEQWQILLNKKKWPRSHFSQIIQNQG